MENLFEQLIIRMEKLQSVYDPHTGQHNILGMLINECKQALHKHGVMQAASECAEGATVGNGAAGQSGSAWCSCEMPIPDMSYTCFKCGKMIDFERGGSAKGALPC